MTHTDEKIGGTSMNDFAAVRDNTIMRPAEMGGSLYRRIIVVSAYGGVTDQLLEHKNSGKPGIFALFAEGMNDESWGDEMAALRQQMCAINAKLFSDAGLVANAN